MFVYVAIDIEDDGRRTAGNMYGMVILILLTCLGVTLIFFVL